MTNLINAELGKRNKPIANIPVGFFEYERGFTKQLRVESELKDDLPLLPKYCCVFETRGERRVGTHLISSLEVLLASFVEVDWEALLKCFADINRVEGSSATETPTEWDFATLTERSFVEEYELKHKENREPLSLIDFFSLKLTTKALGEQTLADKVNELMSIYNIQEGYGKLLTAKLTSLLASGRLFELIILLAAKIGN